MNELYKAIRDAIVSDPEIDSDWIYYRGAVEAAVADKLAAVTKLVLDDLETELDNEE